MTVSRHAGRNWRCGGRGARRGASVELMDEAGAGVGYHIGIYVWPRPIWTYDAACAKFMELDVHFRSSWT